MNEMQNRKVFLVLSIIIASFWGIKLTCSDLAKLVEKEKDLKVKIKKQADNSMWLPLMELTARAKEDTKKEYDLTVAELEKYKIIVKSIKFFDLPIYDYEKYGANDIKIRWREAFWKKTRVKCQDYSNGTIIDIEWPIEISWNEKATLEISDADILLDDPIGTIQVTFKELAESSDSGVFAGKITVREDNRGKTCRYVLYFQVKKSD